MLKITPSFTFYPAANGSWIAVNTVTGERTILTAEMVILLANLNADRLCITDWNVTSDSQMVTDGGILRSQIKQLVTAGVLTVDNTTTSPSRSPLPVFVIGSYRSGTTLLRYIIDAHPRFACPAESKFMSGLNAFVDYPEVTDALVLLGLAKEDIRYGIRQLIESFLSGYAASVGKPRWVDKTPNYYRLLPLIDDIFDRRVLYVFIVRHPLDTIESLEHFFIETAHHGDPDVAAKTATFGKGAYGWALFWVDVYRRADYFLTENPERAHLVRYEDLVTHPLAEAEKLFAFLGEVCPPGIVADAFRLPHTSGKGDPKIQSTTQVHTESLEKWKKWPKSRIAALWPIVEDTAKKFGYVSTL
jgi:protein-tyrosine sulfotransferase